jgi:hypothetical protein
VCRTGRSSCKSARWVMPLGLFCLTDLERSATSLGMMTDEEKKLQRIEDIKELLS